MKKQSNIEYKNTGKITYRPINSEYGTVRQLMDQDLTYLALTTL
jgi:hypothetical protein